MATVKTGIVYLQKDKFQLYSPYAGNILEFRFVPESIRDLDIINSSLLSNLIRSFIITGKIPPCNLIFVLAENAYFTKDFLMYSEQKTPDPTHPAITKEVLQKQADEFVEHVPFDNVVSKTMPIKDGLKVCATNKDFYETIAVAFEHQGFTIESVLPGVVIGNGLSLRPSMDGAMANLILQKANAAKQYNLLGQQVFQPQLKQESEEDDEGALEHLPQSKKQDKKQLYALVGVFASLLIVLIIVYVQSTTPPPPPKQPAFANTTNPTPLVAKPVVLATIIPTTAPLVSPSLLETKNLTVEILSATSSEAEARFLQSKLDAFKFESVNVSTQTSIGTTGAIVSFSSTVSQNVRNAVLAEVKRITTNVTVQENQNSTYDIIVVLGQ